MMKIVREWLSSLSKLERELSNQGYIAVFGGGISFVLRLDLDQKQAGRTDIVAVTEAVHMEVHSSE